MKHMGLSGYININLFYVKYVCIDLNTHVFVNK